MNITEARNLFPHLKTDQIYFNHAAIGPWTTLATDRINEYASQRSGKKIENYPDFIKWMQAQRKAWKITRAKPERLAWIDNVLMV
jgi:selenocysteine lyase/cysteine desulfurase